VRVGGFGGVDGLRSVAADYDVVVDATHPFAAGISRNAAEACADVPLLRLERPGWPADPRWHVAASTEDAGTRAAGLGRRPFLTTGRQDLGRYVPSLASHAVLARVVDPPDLALPPSWRVVTARGPYTLAGELDVLRRHEADVLVTKDSGGRLTRPKLDAADRLGIAVVVVRRPEPPRGVPTVTSVDAALAWLEEAR
jgi:precorrin-6A/cobalt-precorrin-6A reductase